MLNSSFTGETKVFRNQQGFYNISISRKDMNGEYIKHYINVGFPKGTDVPNGAMINIKKAFYTFDAYVSKQTGKTVTSPKIFIQEYEIKGQQAPTTQVSQPTPPIMADNQSEDDLPF